MNFNIDSSNIEILNYLTQLSSNEHSTFINQILKLGFNEFLNKTKSENSLITFVDEKLTNLKLLINEIKLEKQKKILQLTTNNHKGIRGEQLIYNFFKNNNYIIEDTSEIPHSCDLKLYLEEINQNVLIEIKNYKNTVDQKQIDKFYYDLNYTSINLGIFISLQSKIVNTKFPIEWKIIECASNNNIIVLFISECKEEYLYLAIYSLILLFKQNNYKSNLQLLENTELFNDIKYLSTQKDSINQIKQEILSIHDNCTKLILSLYNNLCLFDNNFTYILNKIYKKLDQEINGSNDLYLLSNYLNINNNIKDILEIILSDLTNIYTLENIDDKRIKISKNNIDIGEIKILKTTLNLILNSGLEIKNINKENWNQIKNLII